METYVHILLLSESFCFCTVHFDVLCVKRHTVEHGLIVSDVSLIGNNIVAVSYL